MKRPVLFCLSLLLACLNIVAQPGNNTCNNATPLPVSGNCTNTAGSLYLANQTNPTNGCGNRYDVWYSFTVPAGATTVTISVTLTSNPSTLTTGGTYMELFNTSNCTINNNSIGGCNNISSARTYTGLTPGGTYQLRIYTNSNPNGDPARYGFNICVTSNDDCATATVVQGGGTVSSTVLGASATPAPDGCATPGAANDDVWFRFAAVMNEATASLSSVGSGLAGAGSRVQIFSGSCGSLTPLACGTTMARATGLIAGDTYYVRVYSESTSPVTSNAGFSLSISPSSAISVGSGRMKEIFQQTILSSPNVLADPWEVTYGPDGYLWITEAKGYKVHRLHPVTGARYEILDISQNSTFFTAPEDRAFNAQFSLSTNNPQGGFAGLALHPQLLAASNAKNFVYVSYVHSYVGGSSPTGIFYRNRVVRFEYNTSTGKLESPVSIADTLPGSNDHNSQRMIIAPVNGVNYLFYASGDMGSGQFNNKDRPQLSQDIGSYEGKILRFRLEPDLGVSDPYQQWIPADNPYSNSAVWSVGIRNNQGFAYDSVTKRLYGSSHGPYSDDELNIIERAKNYGHPIVIGYKNDENYAGSSAGAKNAVSTCPLITSEVANANLIGASYKDPLYSAYARPANEINAIWVDAANNDNGPWPSEGWSGLDHYRHTLIPGWKNSLIATSLKWGRVLRFKLNKTGDTVVSTAGKDTISYFGSRNRFRDVAFSKDGKDMFVIIDRSSTTSGPTASNPIISNCGGCVQKYTFLGYADAGGKSTIPTSIPVTLADTLNKCRPGTSVTIAGANNNLWVPITGPDGNIMAEIKANGQDLGLITSQFYRHTIGGVLRQHFSQRYLDRNITITPQTQPAFPVDVRLYLSKDELNNMIADPMSAIDTITDLRILKNTDKCRVVIGSNTTLITPTYAEEHGPDGYVLQTQVSSFSTFYFAASNMQTLPVELLEFKGALVNNVTELDWDTDNEKNTDRFVVERSIDGRNFEEIGTVRAAGNSNSRLHYDFTDANVSALASNEAYYRLRIIHADGDFDYSNTIKITLEAPARLTVFPNPAIDELNISFSAPATAQARWMIMDVTGRIILQGTHGVMKGKNVIPVKVSKLAGGVYHIRVTGVGMDEKVRFRKA